MLSKNLKRTAEEHQTCSVQAKRVREANVGLEVQTPTLTPKAQPGMPINAEAMKVVAKKQQLIATPPQFTQLLADAINSSQPNKVTKKSVALQDVASQEESIEGERKKKKLKKIWDQVNHPVHVLQKVFEHFLPPKELNINFYHHLGPYAPILAKGNPSTEILSLLQENVQLRVLGTIIGAFKDKEAVTPFPKVPVVFRAIEGSYKNSIEDGRMESTFERWLLQNVIKKEVPPVDKGHSLTEIDKRQIWIVEPKMGRKFNRYWGKKKDNHGFRPFMKARVEIQATPPANDDASSIKESENKMKGVEAGPQGLTEDTIKEFD
ncbi:hypothetical protein K443DRAFT_120589 [Laccaria amethystina LaAM-08-1]|uniref:Uncharacterized protein n=1 Tax=Laccaria amethystina LaAM-08-1 TaxID=1095629 RepID=A0A0C9WZL3_9AGAR|nr:hypothetical protein K443DRAFT_120589 [Laccaria amethystina LaAM-08-1]